MYVEEYIKSYILNYQKSYERDYKSQFTKRQTDKWNYEDGCVLIGAVQLYEATGEEIYKQFVLDYVNEAIEDNGTIKGYNKNEYNLDNVNAGRVLFFA